MELTGEFRWNSTPPIKQINENPIGAGFTVDMTPIKKGRSIHKIRLKVTKSKERKQLEDKLKRPPDKPLFDTIRLSARDYERAKKAAPGWDVYALEQEWREWMEGKTAPDKPGAAFVGFCKKWFENRGHG